MKKIIAVIGLMLSIVLVSCNTTQDSAIRRDSPSAEMVELLNLNSVKNGKSINNPDKSQAEYYDIKIAEDAVSTMFVYSTSLDDTLKSLEESESTLKSIAVEPLIFTNTITTTEATNIAGLVSSTVNKETLNVSFDLNASANWSTTVDSTKLLEEYTSGVRNHYVTVLYLPVYVEHYEDSSISLSAYAIMPVYYELTKIEDGKNSSSTFDSFTVKELTFTDAKLLPSA